MNTTQKANILSRICNQEVDIFIKKNTDYGDSFANLRRVMPNAVLVRIYDKWSRLAQLMNGADPKATDESIEDTLRDLANYANMELLERMVEKNKYGEPHEPEPRDESQFAWFNDGSVCLDGVCPIPGFESDGEG